jgi:hypothetical protein
MIVCCSTDLQAVLTVRHCKHSVGIKFSANFFTLRKDSSTVVSAGLAVERGKNRPVRPNADAVGNRFFGFEFWRINSQPDAPHHDEQPMV